MSAAAGPLQVWRPRLDLGTLDLPNAVGDQNRSALRQVPSAGSGQLMPLCRSAA